jgi:demethylspheroidene O-methyltransferase
MATYTALMSASQPLVADDILDAYPLAGHQCLLDVGGGDGTFVQAVARRAPHLRLMLFDLPTVADQACRRLEAAGVAQRVAVHGGSFLRDPLPLGADVVTLVRVVHDHDDGAALALLRSVRQALPSGGTLLLAEPMAGTPGAEAMGDAYFGFYLLAMGRGRPRSAAELTRMLGAAGFDDVRRVPTRMPLQTQLLVASASRVNPVASDVNHS